ncbi:hypothetical protein CI238_01079 [Colletotrichum incanum]|uniref:Uncharacterized protein n=1 Tax=Colletotrichum incanum TaxID=1573173 RepID=A0A166Q469_COLIC|nr:hypothetical protein CI238_01079 [Colletotrichum incanum]OHW91178.1 hypothetical protein CSPAE12_10169 [Colletotrichum incanum]
MHYPTFGHFLLASILAVQGAHSFSLVPTGQVASRFAVTQAPALALALPALAAPQAASIEAREPHHRGKKTKKAKANKRDEFAVDDAVESADHAIEAREPHHRGKKTKNAKANKANKRDESAADHPIEAREPHHRGKKTKKAKANKRDEFAADDAEDAADHAIEAREPHHRGKKTKKAKANKRDEFAADDAEDAADHAIEAREPHHRGKKTKNAKANKANKRDESAAREVLEARAFTA